MAKRSSVRLSTAGATDVGQLRYGNEDALLVREFGDRTLLCVADGLGGHASGDWASARALEVFSEALETALAADEPEPALRAAAASANAAIHREGPERGSAGAATTLVVALVRGREVSWLNVGDSRLYVLSAGILRQVSDDHSLVAEHVRAGLLPESALRTHPQRNIVSRTIGFEPEVEPDTGSFTLADDDTLLLCSDGLFGAVVEEELAPVVAGADLEAAVRELIDLANAAGGPDNITVVLGRLAG